MGYLYEIKNLNVRTDDLTFNNTLYNICAQNGPIILSEKEIYCKKKLNDYQKRLISMLTELKENEISLIAYSKDRSWNL